ncbi:MAG: glycosyltransferase [Chloroflexota bacterium]
MLGPLLPEAEREAAVRRAADLPAVTLREFDGDFPAAAAAADVLVSMGGYNSLCEAAWLGKRAVVVPRLPGPEEQVLRARRFEGQGLVTTVDPRHLSPQSLWSAILEELGAGQSRAATLPFGGDAAIVDALVRAASEA